jgi:hypothetical protein
MTRRRGLLLVAPGVAAWAAILFVVPLTGVTLVLNGRRARES